MDERCRSCWHQEGGRCYDGDFDRLPDGRSTKMADGSCDDAYLNKREALTAVIPSDKLVILSERHEKE